MYNPFHDPKARLQKLMHFMLQSSPAPKEQPKKVIAEHKQFPYWKNRPLNWLILIIVLIYIPTHMWNLFSVPADGSFSAWLLELGLMQGEAVLRGEVWRLITAAFLHANFLHILFNLLAMVFFTLYARQYERSKYAWLWMFFVGAVVGNILIGICSPHTGAVGASGGIMALWGGHIALVLRAYTSKNPELSHVRHTIKLGSELFTLGLQIIVLDHLIPHVAWQCHLGGLFTGLIIGWFVTLRGQLYVYTSRPGIAKMTALRLVTRTVRGRSYEGVDAEIEISPDFDPATDIVVTSTTTVDWRNRVHQVLARVLAGKLKGRTLDWNSLTFLKRVPSVAEAKHDLRNKDCKHEPETKPTGTVSK